MVDLSKRQLLKQGLSGLSVCGVGSVWSTVLLTGCGNRRDPALQGPDENGVRLLPGLQSRIIAESGRPVVNGVGYVWHDAPDGGACFPTNAGSTNSGGWVYVSNSEMDSTGGVGAIEFNASGVVQRAYSILENTNRNCAGGATPWGSWLSCEEVSDGRVWECYPDGRTSAVVRPALGVFNHEAVAVDEKNYQLYLTEDRKDGCLYRFTASVFDDEGFPDLRAGVLEVAVEMEGVANKLSWKVVPDPQANDLEVRYQVAEAKQFNGGEGIAYHDERIIFTTKGDNRVWSYHVKTKEIEVLYDVKDSLTPILSGVDNITVSQKGDIYVAEDGGDLQIVAIDSRGSVFPVMQLIGHALSEVAGLAFSPDGKRLYFSSQRGVSGLSSGGITYEILGF